MISPIPEPADSLMTLKEVMRYLKISAPTVYRLINSGKLPASKVGGQWRFRREDIERYLREKQFHFGTTAIGHLFFYPQVLNKYRAESKSGQEYYLHEQAFDGKVGRRQDYYKIKTLKSAGEKLPVGYQPFFELHYRKVTLKNGLMAIVLMPEQYKNLPPLEQSHWIKFTVPKPELA